MSVSIYTLLTNSSSNTSFHSLNTPPPSHKELEYSFLLPHNISRLWYIIRDANLTTLLCPDIFFPLVLTKGRDTWSIGTEFLGQTTLSTAFTGKCTAYKSFAQIKTLSWHINLHPPSSPTSFTYEYTLYKVTDDDSSVLLITIKSTDTTVLSQLETFFTKKNFFNVVLERVNVLMNESSFNLFQFEGVVIDSDMESIWKFITHFDILKKIAPLIPLDGDSSTQIIPQCIGGESTIYYNNHKSFFQIKTIKYDKRDTWNKWVVLYNVTDSNPLLPKQEVFITVNKIYDDECHISWYHDFKEHVSYDIINKFAFTKKYILKMLQDYLENYYPRNFEDKE